MPRNETTPPATPISTWWPDAPAASSSPPPASNRKPRTNRSTPAFDAAAGAASGRSAASGATLVARRAGTTAATIVASVPSSERQEAPTTGRGAAATGGMPQSNSRASASASADSATPKTTPIAGRDQADDDRLREYRGEHLPAGRADAAQQRHLAGALGDHDREGVADHQAGDEQRDHGEHAEHPAEDVDAVRVALHLVLDPGVTGVDLQVPRDDALGGGRQSPAGRRRAWPRPRSPG